MTHVNATVDQLKREFERIVAEKNPIMLANRSESGEWSDCYYCHPNSTQALTLQKRVNKLRQVQPELAALLDPIVDRLIVKQTEIAVAKEAALKARNAKKAAAIEKALEKEANKKNPYRTLHPEVAALLKQVAEPYRVKAVEFETTRLNHQVDEIKKLAAMYDSFAPETIFPTKNGDHWGNRVQYEKQMNAQAFLDHTGGKWSLRANVDGIVKAKAEQFAEDMVTAFVFKVGTKLSGIVEKKGNLAKTSISGNLQDHWMTFEFSDGACFQVQSQIVWKVSINGKHFAQYPTNFRNVKLSNGGKMETPSESKMKEQFV